ncbi:MAG TPA: hypothetical protein VIL69_14065 [Roseomonas sp.]|jgi:hypothetical protein
MHRIAFALAALALPAITGSAMAQSPAQREAAQQVEQDQRRDRVTDAARDLQTGGNAGSTAVVDDMNRQRPTMTPDRADPRAVSPAAPGATNIPLLSDNPQR